MIVPGTSLTHRGSPFNLYIISNKGPSQKYLEANEVKYFSLGGKGVGDFMVTFHFFKNNWLHACVYHHRMKPKVGRNFTSERGGRGSREK